MTDRSSAHLGDLLRVRRQELGLTREQHVELLNRSFFEDVLRHRLNCEFVIGLGEPRPEIVDGVLGSLGHCFFLCRVQATFLDEENCRNFA